jgi:hypothetical protein
VDENGTERDSFIDGLRPEDKVVVIFDAATTAA